MKNTTLFALIPLLFVLLGGCKSTQKAVEEAVEAEEVTAGTPSFSPDILSTLTEIQRVDGLLQPASIVATEYHLFVSNLGGDFSSDQPDGDGYLARLNRAAPQQAEMVYPGLDNPRGMVVEEEVLYIADGAFVRMFFPGQLQPGENYSVEKIGARSLHDIVALKNGAFVVCDHQTNRLFYLPRFFGNTSAEALVEYPLPIQGPTALAVDAARNYLYVVTSGTERTPGTLGRISLPTDPGEDMGYFGEFRPYPEFRGNFRDLDVIGGGSLLVLDAGSDKNPEGRLRLFDPETEAESPIPGEEPFPEPQGLLLDPENLRVYVSTALDGVLRVFGQRP